jgi:hypothetical protein
MLGIRNRSFQRSIEAPWLRLRWARTGSSERVIAYLGKLRCPPARRRAMRSEHDRSDQDKRRLPDQGCI